MTRNLPESHGRREELDFGVRDAPFKVDDTLPLPKRDTAASITCGDDHAPDGAAIAQIWSAGNTPETSTFREQESSKIFLRVTRE
jgi:hypothetical protein